MNGTHAPSGMAVRKGCKDGRVWWVCTTCGRDAYVAPGEKPPVTRHPNR